MKVLAILPPFLPVEMIRRSVSAVLPGIEVRTDEDFVGENLLGKMPNLKFIQVASTGYDNVDLEAVRRAGIMLANAPSSNKESVAEHVIGMILYFLKDFRYLDNQIRSGSWPMLTASRDLSGKIVGIVGMGAIGQRLAERLLPFGCSILYYDVRRISREMEVRYGSMFTPLNELLSVSDIITLHVPLTDSTRKMIGDHEFSLMKDGCMFINTSRAEVVDGLALLRAVEVGKIKAGIDVYEKEPPDFLSPIFRAENTLFTPHIAGVTLESQARFIQETAANVLRYMQGLNPMNRVI
ncbi:2-hydroxyacid dehydrogenase [Thermoplasmatales archaeon AK]|nr:2-hydroxyacid dehydrogenase [Thermoplasmatales archaeon AK]